MRWQLAQVYVLPMDHYRSNGRYRLFLPYAHDLPYSLLVCSSTIQRGPFSCVTPSVSPIDDGLSEICPIYDDRYSVHTVK